MSAKLRLAAFSNNSRIPVILRFSKKGKIIGLAIPPPSIYVSSMKTHTYPWAVPSDPVKNLKPLTPEESRRCFARPDPEFDALAAHCAALPVPIPEE